MTSLCLALLGNQTENFLSINFDNKKIGQERNPLDLDKTKKLSMSSALWFLPYTCDDEHESFGLFQ